MFYDPKPRFTAFFSSSIRIQLELPILDLTISNLPNPVTADVEYEVLCQVSGSQPPSEVTWRLGEAALPTEEGPRLTHDNNLTTSTLFFVPKIKDQASKAQLGCPKEAFTLRELRHLAIPTFLTFLSMYI